jgi:hypothetical protein
MPRGVAQTVARLVWDQEVVGSSPAAPTVSRGSPRQPATDVHVIKTSGSMGSVVIREMTVFPARPRFLSLGRGAR